jgi:chromosome segregation ATPase
MSADRFARLHERALTLLEEERQERQAAQRSALQMQSQLQGLQHTLQSYQRVLTENAESLAERESLRLAAEKQALEIARERETIQDEQQALLEKLKLAQDRTSWLEKRFNRLPRWVRRWLDVG